MICKNCGKELKTEAAFCPNCGKALVKQEINDNLTLLNWRVLRILGIIISMIATWLPCMSYGSINFSKGSIETFSGSLWKFYTTEMNTGSSIYIGLVCMCLSIVFTIFNKNILSIICWVFGISPAGNIIAIIAIQDIKKEIGVYVTIVGWLLVIVSIIMKKILVVRDKAIQQGDMLMASQAVGRGRCWGSMFLGIVGFFTSTIPLMGLVLAFAGVIIGIYGIKSISGKSISAIVGIILCIIALLFSGLIRMLL